MEKIIIEGTPVVDGVAMGEIFYLNTDYSQKLDAYEKDTPENEKHCYEEALAGAIGDLNETLENGDISEEEQEIIGNHVMLLEDEAFSEVAMSAIEDGAGAPEGVLTAVETFKAMFEEIEDEYLRDRANDVVDIGNRVLRKLLGISEAKITGENLVVIAKDIEPALMASLSEKQVQAILLENGSKTSHTIIIAKSKGFVTMVGVDSKVGQDYDGHMAIVNTSEKQAILNPDENEIEDFSKEVQKEAAEKEVLMKKADEPAISKDGKVFVVAANVSSPDEMDKARENGCEGVGLYRTEFLFMDKATLPDEEVQFEAYKALLGKAQGDRCIIRTLDIGGDKKCDCLGLWPEENPFLGYRAVRICLDKKDIFKTQLRALLRASAFGKLGVMVPMIDTVEEIMAAKALFEEVKSELRIAKIAFDEKVEFGIMTETPASAFMSSVFAKYVDFFSIGTNDLVQYTMAVDRGNQKVGYLYDYFNPAVLRAINEIVKGAHANGISVGMCGEMAGDRLAVPFLIAIGLDEFSMSISSAPRVKEQIRTIDSSCCDVERLLMMESAQEVREYLGELINS